jgi:hypothetical protein
VEGFGESTSDAGAAAGDENGVAADIHGDWMKRGGFRAQCVWLNYSKFWHTSEDGGHAHGRICWWRNKASGVVAMRCVGGGRWVGGSAGWTESSRSGR